MMIFVAFGLSYLLGSFPTAYLMGRFVQGIDIRTLGSGNAGATNVFRILGWKAALPVIFIDILKGFLPVFFFSDWLNGSWQNFGGLLSNDTTALFKIFCGIFAIVGHVFPLYTGFRGGKGVLTALGVILALTPLASFFALIIALSVLFITRIVSPASLTGALVYPIIVFFIATHETHYYFYFSLLCAWIIVWTHRSNILRLARGEEKKIFNSQKKT